ncbi:MAG TPA: HIT family protein [Actinomycetota bacterium]|nr:HIT family protein [Actinomycetota bacterium]
MCVFCDVVDGRVPAHIVYRDEACVAFLDNRPIFPGHLLLVPARHYETITDLPAGLVEPVFACARKLAGAVERAMDAHGTFVAMNNRVSQSVPHFHVHIVPRRRKDGLRGFFWPRTRYEDESAAERTAARIRRAVEDAATDDG